jgi:hypothetical protein
MNGKGVDRCIARLSMRDCRLGASNWFGVDNHGRFLCLMKVGDIHIRLSKVGNG